MNSPPTHIVKVDCRTGSGFNMLSVNWNILFCTNDGSKKIVNIKILEDGKADQKISVLPNGYYDPRNINDCVIAIEDETNFLRRFVPFSKGSWEYYREKSSMKMCDVFLQYNKEKDMCFGFSE